MATGTAVGSRGSIGAKLGGLVDTAVGRMELPVSYRIKSNFDAVAGVIVFKMFFTYS